ncbi:MAG: phenylacetate--CoA ligase [Candidatus Omnitrophica bacterium]|nr:phenylacetate--CoA ligase [Candidatus Omnitrophota bacterium]MCM8806733.1 phenylacetate--CoA ligase [Candidatus Omnitrophota bacterium]
MQQRQVSSFLVDFWEKSIETIDEKKLKELQLERLNYSIEIAKKSEFYGQKLKDIKKIKNFDELEKIPFTTKEDLLQNNPLSFLTTDLKNIVRVHSSSGTTGRSKYIFYTKKDIENWADLVARCLFMVGIRKNDIFQNMMSYGLFTGGLGLHYGAEKIGILVIPAGVGNTEKQIELMRELKTTVIHITPSYLLYIAHYIEEIGLSPSEDFNLKTAIVGAEPYSENTRKKLENIFKINVYNCYGLSEMNGPGVAFECPYKDGLHLWEDNYYMEIIDPKTGKILGENEEGELVLTTLKREGMPLIRYRTGDLTKILRERCECGRTHRKIMRIKGRSDDMFIVKGVNIFPSQIEAVIMEFPEVDKNYQIIIDRKGGLDILTVQVEIKKEFFKGEINELRDLQERIKEKLKEKIFVSPIVELVETGTLPTTTGKAKRVIDKRRL